ncbi:MAG TPA: class I SAM-dependent methyltransferase [bacterium]|jgi:16S rRNA (guanine1207-N2)-methyltransferase
MQQYFTRHPAASSRPRIVHATLRGRDWTFMTDRGVFSHAGIDAGTRLLAETMDLRASDEVLDLGCGYGVLGLVAAPLVPAGRVVMVDVNERATTLAKENARAAALTNVEVLQGDGTAPVADRRFDVALSNPPIRAGKATVRRLMREVHDCLRPGGRFYFVARTAQGAKTLARDLSAIFDTVEEIERGGGYRVYLAARK